METQLEQQLQAGMLTEAACSPLCSICLSFPPPPQSFLPLLPRKGPALWIAVFCVLSLSLVTALRVLHVTRVGGVQDLNYLVVKDCYQSSLRSRY